MKLSDYLEQLQSDFEESDLVYGHGTSRAEDEAVFLAYTLLDLDFDKSPQQQDRNLTQQELVLMQSVARERIDERKPLAYLLTKAWFGGHLFHCDERALVPRSPIAELISNRFQPLLRQSPRTILDMCSGGGCIGIACALEFEDSLVDLVDLSADALELAGENIALHGLENRVKAIQSDCFECVEKRYDLIVANPPYVSHAEYAALPPEYLQEPVMGLVSERAGLQLPLKILYDAVDYLQTDGLLVMEVGYSHELLAESLPQVPLLWLEFEHGGEGVFAISAADLKQFRECFI